MQSLSIGVSALTTNQRLLDLTGQNIANAGTEGYHRQVAELAARTTGGVIGVGVEITRISRAINTLVEQSLNNANSTSENVTAQLATLSQVQTLLNPTDGSLNDLLQKFFNQADQLSSQPADLTQRRVFLTAATALTDGINSLAQSLSGLQNGLGDQISQAVDGVNQLLPQIATLNGQIQRLTLRGTEPNDLLDQRDQLIAKLSSLMNVQTVQEDFGQVGVIAGGSPLVLGNQFSRLEVFTDPTLKTPAVRMVGSTGAMAISDGQLAGLLGVNNQALPALSQQLEALTQQLIRGIDEIHATSIPLNGSFTLLAGQRSVRNSTIPLAQAGLAFPPQAGKLYISVTNHATGARAQTAIDIDPATQSLQDVAAALGGVPNIQAIVDGQTQTLRILAAPGFSFDFSNNPPTSPATTVANTDTAGILTALGLNSFFQGASAGSVKVRPDLISNPTRLAISRTGQPADSGALQRIANFRTALVMAGGTQSLQQFLATMIGQSGAQVQNLTQQQSAQAIVTQRLKAEQQSVSGVDANEELVKMMNFQRAFQAAARFISVVDQTLEDLVRIVQ